MIKQNCPHCGNELIILVDSHARVQKGRTKPKPKDPSFYVRQRREKKKSQASG